MYEVWDEQTAEELGRSFGLRVEGFSTLGCGSLQEAIKLLKLAGFSQPRNPPYWWEMEEKTAIISKSGRITFRRQPTPQEARIQEQRYREWRKSREEVLSQQRFNEDVLSNSEYNDNQGAYRMTWDAQIAQEFADEFGLEVKSFSTVECGSIRDANKLLKAFGFWQKSNYHWELGSKEAINHENGHIIFRRRRTPQEERIHHEKYEEHVKKWKESCKPKKRNWLW